MNWILVATPIFGVIAVVAAVVSLRHFLPLNRDAPSPMDLAEQDAGSVAALIGKAVGAAIRDERRKGIEVFIGTGAEIAVEEELDDLISEQQKNRRVPVRNS